MTDRTEWPSPAISKQPEGGARPEGPTAKRVAKSTVPEGAMRPEGHGGEPC